MSRLTWTSSTKGALALMAVWMAPGKSAGRSTRIPSTPQDLALEVASKAILMFRKLNVPILGIIENMSYYICSHCGQRDDIFGHGGAREAGARAGIPFLGEIPLAAAIRATSDAGRPVVLESADAIGRSFHEVAGQLAARISIANAGGTANEPVLLIQ
jgi:ATP-binding protein involved in chromosome partitioning